MNEEIVDFISHNKVIAICRRVYGRELINLAQALHDGGVRLMEVTFDQSDPENCKKTADAVKLLNQNFKDMMIGVGTCLTMNQLHAAKEANAKYIISPNTNVEIIKETKRLGLVSIPGAFTPSEIVTADIAGADFVKLFPTRFAGLQYVKDIKGPLSHIKFIATAGITPDNFKDYLNLGFYGAGISSYLTSRKLLDEEDFETLTAHAKELVDIKNSK